MFSSLGDSATEQWHVGLGLIIPLGDLTLEQGEVNARVGLRQTRVQVADLRNSIHLEVQDAVRNVEVSLKQVGLARRVRVLSKTKLEIEGEKLRLGRSSNFQLVTFQNDLADAQFRELDAIINYLNSLTLLDQALGTTLQTWQIDLRTE